LAFSNIFHVKQIEINDAGESCDKAGFLQGWSCFEQNWKSQKNGFP
jgi:hypothetical protein